MAKTFRNLWPQVVAWDNLLRAYRKCRRRKRYRQPATDFDFAWEENLLRLQQDLLNGTYTHGPYYHFHISEPKPRKISAAPFRDRVVHHTLVAVLEPLFEQRFVFDSYACRVGKGTHRAIRRTQHFQRRFPWCLKTDIVKFFPNIDHEILLNIIRKRIADPQVISLIETILSDEVTGVEFGDQRLTNRLVRIVEALGARPHDSIPAAIGTRSEMEATYRFFANKKGNSHGDSLETFRMESKTVC